MKVGEILVPASIGNQAVAGLIQVEFGNEALHGRKQIDQKIAIFWR